MNLLPAHENYSGGGLVSYSELQSGTEPPIDPNVPKKKKVVVLGTGWAGTSLLKDLDASLYDVQVVSPRNYFAFTPLLPSVTCGTVEARSIVEPVRNIIKKVERKSKQSKITKNNYLYVFFLLKTIIINVPCFCLEIVVITLWSLLGIIFSPFLF